jgi:hypothetical protein
MTMERDITTTREAFIGALRLAFPGGVAETDRTVRVSRDGAVMEIAITRGADRQLTLLCLPTIRVRMRFVAGSPGQQQAMLEHMDRAMQRGGG